VKVLVFEFRGRVHTAVFSDSFQKITIQLDPQSKKVILSAKNSDVGESEEQISGSITGEGITLSFNHKYITAPLSFIETDTITLSASGIGRAVIIRGSGDTSYLYLVMPMNN
jgi:DNA polymerase III sliding clamp (beta) subunit (PCNA family)